MPMAGVLSHSWLPKERLPRKSVSEKMMLDHLEEMLLLLGLRLSRSHSVRDHLPLLEQGFSNLSHTLGPEKNQSSRAAKRACSLPSVAPGQTV